MAILSEDYNGTLRLHLTMTEPMLRLLIVMTRLFLEQCAPNDDSDEVRMAQTLLAEFLSVLGDI